MDAFCHDGFSSSLAFCQVGDAEIPLKAAVDATCHEIKRFWEVGDAEEASIQGIKDVGDAEGCGNKLFCQGNEAEEKLSCDVHGSKNAPLYAFGNGFCQVGDGNGFHEVGDGNGFHDADDWVSPRISFSKDFVMSDTDSLYQSPRGTISSERKKGEHDIKDNYSAEFAFLKDGPAHGGAPDQAKGFMLSADELFFDGKLLPLPFPSIWAAGDDLSLSSSCDMHRQEGQQKSHNRPMSRHLSFEIPNPSSSSSSSSCLCISSPCKNSRLDKSLACSDACVWFSSSLPSSPSPPSSSVSLAAPPLPSSASSTSLPPTSPAPSPPLPSSLSITPASPLPPSSVIKCSTKLKHLFKSKIFFKDSSPSQHTRDDGVTSTCRLPISSRSFWPFSRSNSAGVTKSTAPPPLPCRSNSAGVSHTCDAPSLKDLDVIDVARWSTSSSVGGSKEQDPIPTVRGENSHTSPNVHSEFTVPLEVASPERNQKDCRSLDSSLQLENMKLESLVVADQHAVVAEGNTNVCNHSSHCVDNAESRPMSGNVKRLGFQGQSKASGKKVIGTSGKGSPGKRKGVSGVKGNGGKIVLRNLERCSAEKKLGRDGWRGLNRRGSFPVGARVSPVLNVAVCRGPSTPKVGLFRFNTSLFSKKEKPAEAAINWRNGA